jgi:hypothetical protein
VSAGVSAALVAFAVLLVGARRRFPVPRARTPLVEVLDATGNMPRAPRSWLLGWPPRIVGFGLLAAAAVPLVALYAVVVSDADFGSRLALGAGLIAAGFVLGVPGQLLWTYGKENLAIAAVHGSVEDSRRPVLYLRPFPADSVADQLISHSIYFALSSYSEEEQLARAMSKIGPFVAIGRPGERLPQVGAIRLYVTNPEWQEMVTRLMSEAALVVLRAGFSRGFWWEAQLALRTLEPQKLVVLVPFGPDEYEHFRERARDDLQVTLPPLPESVRADIARRMQGKAWGVVYFRTGWVPEWAVLVERDLASSPNALYGAYLRRMWPVADQLGADPFRWRFPWSAWQLGARAAGSAAFVITAANIINWGDSFVWGPG